MMREQDYFFKVKTPDEVRKILIETAQPLPAETVDIMDSLGRVLVEDVRSPSCLPGFDRAIMDGFAVRAQDTFGASPNAPAYLLLSGEVKMGEPAEVRVSPGSAVRVSTGSMMPDGADAVVMIEYTEFLDDETIEVVRPVAPGDNVVRKDEDLRADEIILYKGHVVRPQDIGALAGAGLLSVRVSCKPRVAIISSGDEIIPPDQTPQLGQIRDINSYSLSSLIHQAGGIPIRMGVVKDDYNLLRSHVEAGLADANIVLISGGSSIGARDVTLDVIRSIDSAEVLVHGVSIRPGKPTIIAKVKDKYIFGLPGNPVSAMMIFSLFVSFLMKLLSSAKLPPWEPQYVRAKLGRNIASAPGREDYVCVRLLSAPEPSECRALSSPTKPKTEEEVLAEPILGKSALISTMVKADGLIRIPMEVEGLEAGSEVSVIVFPH